MLKFVVDVQDPYDPLTGIGGHRTRLTFGTEQEALVAFARAALWGLDASFPVKVRDRKAVAA